MVATRKAPDLSLTALLSARGQNVIRNTFLSEGLTSAESPGISEAAQLCMCLPISARQSHASFISVLQALIWYLVPFLSTLNPCTVLETQLWNADLFQKMAIL